MEQVVAINQYAHVNDLRGKKLVELVLGLARFLFGNRRTFIFFDRHANIAADRKRSNCEDWPPLWIAAAKVLERA